MVETERNRIFIKMPDNHCHVNMTLQKWYLILTVLFFQYKVLLYISKQQQVTHAHITTAFTLTVNDYAFFIFI